MFLVRLGAGVAVAVAVVLAAGPAGAASGWTVVAVPHTGGGFSSVGADSGTDAWAVGTIGSGVGASPLADHWDGRSWQQVAVPKNETTVHLNAVSAAGTTDAWAVGSYGNQYPRYQTPVAYHWNGKTWTQIPATDATHAAMRGVADIGAGDAWAVGAGLEHWDGTSWTQLAYPEPADAVITELGVVSADAANDVWAVGSYYTATCNGCWDTFSVHWDGVSWQLVPMPPVDRSTDPSLVYQVNSIDAISPLDVWAVGNAADVNGTHALIEHWDGTSWSVVASPSPTVSNLIGVSGSSPDSVWALGSSVSLLWDGTSWTTVSIPALNSTSSLASLSATPGASTVWAVGHTATSGTLNPLALEHS
jgi:hypothetical protein